MATGKSWGYWVATGLFCLGILPGGIFDLLLTESAREVFAHLGYPLIVGPILGVWKILGVAALLWPGKPRLKEWAYAGFTFDLTGAAASNLWIGDPVLNAIVPLLGLAVLFTSYLLRPASRR